VNLRLKQATYRHIESEIYSYAITVQTIERLRSDIIHRSSNNDSAGLGISKRSSDITSVTESKAVRLATGRRITEMERITNAIRDTYLRIKNDEFKRIIWVKYNLAIDWKPPVELKALIGDTDRFSLPVDTMLKLLNIDRTTFFEYRNGFVYSIAQQLGWY